MRVKSKKNGTIYNAVKAGDSTYIVEGKELSADKMRELFDIVKEEQQVSKAVASEAEEKINEPSMIQDTMSEDISELAKAIVKANGEVSNGKKNKEAYNYNYMTLDSLVDAVRPILAKNGLALMQTHQLNGINVGTTTTLIHESGQWIKSYIEMPLSKSKTLSIPQQIGVVCTYSRRYTIQAMLMIAAEDDNDGATN